MATEVACTSSRSACTDRATIIKIVKPFTMKKFEHKVVRVETISMMKYKYDFTKIEAMLTGFGLEGWELINVIQDTDTDARKYLILFLKREI